MRFRKPDHDGHIWLELGYVPGNDEFNARQAEAGNLALRRLLGENTAMKFWTGARTPYNLTTSPAGTYIGLNDDGHWFNVFEPDNDADLIQELRERIEALAKLATKPSTVQLMKALLDITRDLFD